MQATPLRLQLWLPSQCGAKLDKRQCIQHVVRLQPAAAGLGDAVSHDVVADRPMGVGIDHEFRAEAPGELDITIIEIEAVWIGIDFELSLIHI